MTSVESCWNLLLMENLMKMYGAAISRYPKLWVPRYTYAIAALINICIKFSTGGMYKSFDSIGIYFSVGLLQSLYFFGFD